MFFSCFGGIYNSQTFWTVYNEKDIFSFDFSTFYGLEFLPILDLRNSGRNVIQRWVSGLADRGLISLGLSSYNRECTLVWKKIMFSKSTRFITIPSFPPIGMLPALFTFVPGSASLLLLPSTRVLLYILLMRSMHIYGGAHLCCIHCAILLVANGLGSHWLPAYTAKS